jgi:hypothetical protein
MPLIFGLYFAVVEGVKMVFGNKEKYKEVELKDLVWGNIWDQVQKAWMIKPSDSGWDKSLGNWDNIIETIQFFVPLHTYIDDLAVAMWEGKLTEGSVTRLVDGMVNSAENKKKELQEKYDKLKKEYIDMPLEEKKEELGFDKFCFLNKLTKEMFKDGLGYARLENDLKSRTFKFSETTETWEQISSDVVPFKRNSSDSLEVHDKLKTLASEENFKKFLKEKYGSDDKFAHYCNLPMIGWDTDGNSYNFLFGTGYMQMDPAKKWDEYKDFCG